MLTNAQKIRYLMILGYTPMENSLVSESFYTSLTDEYDRLALGNLDVMEKVDAEGNVVDVREIQWEA